MMEPRKPSHAADDDDDESIDDDRGTHAEEGGHQWRGKDAAERRHGAAEAEHAGANQLNVGAERLHHFRILRYRADQQPRAGAFQEQPHAYGGKDAKGDEEQTILRKRLIEQKDHAAQNVGSGDPVRVRTPQNPYHLAHYHGETEGHHEIGAAIAARIQPAQEHFLKSDAHGADNDRGDNERHPERARCSDCRITDIGTEHEERAMRKIDDTHDAEDQRQPARNEEQNRRLRECIETLRQQKADKIHAAPPDCV